VPPEIKGGEFCRGGSSRSTVCWIIRRGNMFPMVWIAVVQNVGNTIGDECLHLVIFFGPVRNDSGVRPVCHGGLSVFLTICCQYSAA